MVGNDFWGKLQENFFAEIVQSHTVSEILMIFHRYEQLWNLANR